MARSYEEIKAEMLKLYPDLKTHIQELDLLQPDPFGPMGFGALGKGDPIDASVFEAYELTPAEQAEIDREDALQFKRAQDREERQLKEAMDRGDSIPFHNGLHLSEARIKAKIEAARLEPIAQPKYGPNAATPADHMKVGSMEGARDLLKRSGFGFVEPQCPNPKGCDKGILRDGPWGSNTECDHYACPFPKNEYPIQPAPAFAVQIVEDDIDEVIAKNWDTIV